MGIHSPLSNHIYLLVTCHTHGTAELFGLSLYLQDVTLASATVAVSSTIFTAVHGQVVGRAELGETGVAAELVHHILIIHLMPDLEQKEYTARAEGICVLISEMC